MGATKETVGQLWVKDLSLVACNEGEPAYLEACRIIVDANPKLAMDSKALHFAAQGWLFAQQQKSVPE